MQERNSKFLRFVQLFLDLVILNGSFLLAASLRFDDLKVENPEYYNYYVQLWVFLNLIWLLIAFVIRMYDSGPKMEIRRSISRALNALVIQLFVLTLMLVILKFDLYSRLFFLYFYSSFVPLILISRWVFITRLRRYFHNPENRRPVILLGGTQEARDFYRLISGNPEYGLKIVKWFADNSDEADGSLKSGLEEIAGIEAQEIFCGMDSGDEMIPEWYRAADASLMRFRYLPSLGIKNVTNAQIELYGDIPVLISRKEPLEYRHNRILKRAFDLLFSLLVFILIFSWLFPILAIAVKLSSRGPVIFRQKRSGINNDVFEVYKFRSMVVNEEADTRQAQPNDERITRVGQFLRRHNLDELPSSSMYSKDRCL